MFAGFLFGGVPFAGALAPTGTVVAAQLAISLTVGATLSDPPARLATATTIAITVRADLVAPIRTTAGIVIDGVPVTGRVRIAGLTIRDILNDAPNTCNFRMEGDGPAVGQSVRVTMGGRLLFSGAVQSVTETYELLPEHVAWDVTAIDDTAEANARRPFGTFIDVSATTIAETITTTYAPGFSTAGIVAGLPTVRITFDGAETFIACLTRLASAVGGYCKIEDHTVYLFLEDPDTPPDPIDDAHPFLDAPPIQANIDASQLRTRVYGKGYGESVQADLAPGETQIPIQDGAQFPPLGGAAIAGLTADGAQSDRITFAGVDLGGGGSLVGPGAGPTTAPALEVQGGFGVDAGAHTVSVAFLTAAGQSLAGPPAPITVGTLAPPPAAPLAATAIAGTGPDQGAHEYAASFVTAYGETVAGPISNAIVTSAAVGAIPPPPSSGINGTFQSGIGIETGIHDYKTTLLNATGETEAGDQSGHFTAQPTPPITAFSPSGTLNPAPGGNMEPGTYHYFTTATVAGGESLPAAGVMAVTVGASGSNAATVLTTPQNSDGRVTGIKIYRSPGGPSSTARFLIALPPPTGFGSFVDTASQASIASNALPPTVDTTSQPNNRLALSGIALGPAGTTGRRLYRRFNTTGAHRLVTTLSNNTSTTFLDTVPNANLGVDAPTSNTTGTAVQRIPVSNIPIGPAGVTARNLYRRFNGAGTFRRVTTIANNTGTTFQDAVTNAALGPAALTTATAIGNQIRATLPIGGNAVTAREVYMSPVANAVRRRVAVINDNVTTIAVLTASDSEISNGAFEPTADTSGLQQPQGQVNPGAPVLPVASSGPFRPGGGWVSLSGSQVVKYTGISGNTLTGIPPTGSGAITTAVVYGSPALPAPMLIGVSGLSQPMLKGAAVHLWVQRDDLIAQAEHAARTGGDGIVEFLIVDTRRGVDSLTARCDADLALFARPIVTVGYVTRDLKTKSGKTVRVSLTKPPIDQTLTIQDVTISGIDIVPGLAPRYAVRASSVRFSLEDTLRRLIAGGQIVGGSGT